MLDNTSRIKKLSPLLINQLAAGEVVTRPAAVVKELLENAIDAGATHIEVRITQGGMGMIEVVDDGVGIHPDDMVMAITRHATSKVADIANLHGINTLGFRGEALAATAAVSRLTLTSSHDASGIGRQLQVTGVLADTPKLMPVVHSRGSTITVRDLYFNVPARRGNLKSIATEFAHIETIVREVALVHADIALNLFHDNKKRLALSTSSDSFLDNSGNIESRLPLARLEQALGIALKDDALAVKVDLSNLLHSSPEPTKMQTGTLSHNLASIEGWLWPSQSNDANNASAPKLLYINGRLIKELLISNQLRQLAQSANLSNMGYALYFELPLHWLNVNVHPSKQRIKISSLNNIMAHLSHAISLKIKGISNTSVNHIQPATKISASSYLADNRVSQSSVGYNPPTSFTSSKVQEKIQPYQSLPFTSLSSIPMNSRIDPSMADDKSVHQGDTGNLGSAATDAIKPSNLPHCIDIISDIDNGINLHKPNSAQNNSLSKLTYLLFYEQGKLILIDEIAWRTSLNSLFDSNSQQVVKDMTSAANINQQLTHYAAQMSEHDRIAFTIDIHEVIKLNTIKAISSTELFALILDS